MLDINEQVEQTGQTAPPATRGAAADGPQLYAAIEKRRFQMVIDELNSAVFEWDLRAGTFYSSDSYQKYAFSRVDQRDILNGRGPLDTVHPDDVRVLRQFYAQKAAGRERAEVVLRVKTVEGDFRWCRMIGFFYKDEDGVPTRTVGVIIDVDEEHERSFALDSLLNELPGGVAILYYDGEMKCQYYNDRFAAFNGRTREETDAILADGSFVKEVVAPADYQRVLETVDSCAMAGEPLDFTFRFIHKEEGMRWVHLSGSKIREENGFPVYYCVFTIPPEEVRLYRDAVEDAPVGIMVIERARNSVLYINDTARSMYGFTDRDIVSSRPVPELLREHGDRPILTRGDIAALKSGEYTQFHGMRGGRYLAVRARTLVWNSVDAVILYVTDETRAHEEQAKLQQLVNRVPCGIGIYKIERGAVKLTYLNEAYYRLLGLRRGALSRYAGARSEGAVHPEDAASVDELLRALCRGEDERGVRLRVKNGAGEWVWLNLAAAVVERGADRLMVYVAFSDCDQLVRSQQELKKNQVRESALLASIPGGVAIYRMKTDGRVLTEYVSAGLAKMCGYERGEFAAYLADNAMVNVCAADIPIVMAAAGKSLEEHAPISITYRIHTKADGDILTRLDANPMDENELGEDDLAVWYAVHTRVSKSAELAIREQAHYRSVLEMLGIAYWEWSRENGFYTSEDYSLYALSQHDINEVAAKRVLEGIVHPEDLEQLRAYLATADQDESSASTTLRLLMTDGSYQWTELITFIDRSPSGELIRRSGTLRNVNDDWLKQRSILEKALEEAQSANMAKTAFLSRISHDMRTPLNGILGLAALLRDRISDQELQNDLAQLELSGQYLMNLVNDTLDVRRIESGNMELHPTVCEGRAIFDSVTALAMPAVTAKNIHVEIKISGLQYPMLYIDIGRVEQIMLNVLGNAAKFTPEGGHITCTMTRLSEENGVITDQVCVEDDGIGISEEFLPHIFEPFTQDDGSKKNARQGTGLGMMITKQLVEMMGGTIRVASEPGKGTRVTYTLVMPVATEQQVAQWRRTQNSSADDMLLSGRRILLCEDHPLNAKISTRLLEKKGMVVVLAENGKLGLELFTTLPEGYFDAILMDVRMPVMDGLEATAEIRALSRPDAALIPIIAITANAFAEDIQETRQAGMNAHLSKPINAQRLYDTLCELLQKRPGWRSGATGTGM